MHYIQNAVDIGIDLAVPTGDQTILTVFSQQEASITPWLEGKRKIQVVPIRCETCHRPSRMLILNKQNRHWECENCCSDHRL